MTTAQEVVAKCAGQAIGQLGGGSRHVVVFDGSPITGAADIAKGVERVPPGSVERRAITAFEPS